MSEAYSKYSSEGDVSCEILEMPKKGFLGIGSTPAKIKVVIDDGEDEIDLGSIISDMKAMKVETDRGGDGKPAPAEKNPQPKTENKANAEKAPAKAKEQPAKKEEKKPAAPVEKKEEKKPAPAAEKKEKNAAPVQASVPAAPAKKVVDEDKKKKYDPVTDVEMQFAVEFIETVLRDLEIEAKAVPVKDEDGAYVGINIEGDSTGTLIGHHGETLDAIQYLANLSASRRSPTPNREFLKITVDIENYREKREETLRALARRMASKAVKYKRNFVLEPMNPYERRIIHSEIQLIDNVDTHSVGSDENRKVVVTYEGSDKIDRRNRQRRRRGGYNANSANAENVAAPSETFDDAGMMDEAIDLD